MKKCMECNQKLVCNFHFRNGSKMSFSYMAHKCYPNKLQQFWFLLRNLLMSSNVYFWERRSFCPVNSTSLPLTRPFPIHSVYFVFCFMCICILVFLYFHLSIFSYFCICVFGEVCSFCPVNSTSLPLTRPFQIHIVYLVFCFMCICIVVFLYFHLSIFFFIFLYLCIWRGVQLLSSK